MTGVGGRRDQDLAHAARGTWTGDPDELRRVLPGHGTELAELNDVAAVAALTGRDPRRVSPTTGQPWGANVALLRATLRRWACPGPRGQAGAGEDR